MSFIDRPFDAFDPASLAEYIAHLEKLAARGMDADREMALARDLLALARDRERVAADGSKLTGIEAEICAATGVSEEKFLATRRAHEKTMEIAR